MHPDNIVIIVAAEIVAACLFIVLIMALRNRKLGKLIRKLQARLEEVVAQARKHKAAAQALEGAQSASSDPALSYGDFLDEQLEFTRDYHEELGSQQDITLDLDPQTPAQRRTAALRNAFLIAEKEATREEEAFGWDGLAKRYEQILSFNQDYAPKDDAAQLQQLESELVQAKNRIANLERFKVLYFDLEAEWEKCKGRASAHYAELQTLAGTNPSKGALESALEQYQASYKGLDTALAKGAELPNTAAGENQNHKQEIQHLRQVAADQHKIIGQLQSQLKNASSDEERTKIVQGLQQELQKQARFMQESETCIKLLEDELNAVNDELELLKSQTKYIAELELNMNELQEICEKQEHELEAIETANRELLKQVTMAQETGQSPPNDAEQQNTQSLKAELFSLQTKYNELEEKFLNLKLRG